jgi:hypothetical protein
MYLNKKIFQKYDNYNSIVPIYKISSNESPTIHRFYDTSPISPSGKYIALTQFPTDLKLPEPKDLAKIIVIDLSNGNIIYETETAAWDTQVGAHVQWGEADEKLFFNRLDVNRWIAYGCKVNIFSQKEKKLDNSIYMVSPDGKKSLTPSLLKINLVQPGYGAIVPLNKIEYNNGVSATDGLFIVDNETGGSSLLLSFKDIVDSLANEFIDLEFNNGAFYGFHTKWSPSGEKIAFIIRWLDKGGKHNNTKNYLITCNADGSNILMALNAKRWKGGHHPNWYPDSENIVMNLSYPNPKAKLKSFQVFLEKVARKLGMRYFSNSSTLLFSSIHYTGSDVHPLSELHIGSGHPTIHSSLKYLLSDAYVSERVSFSDGSVPIRLISLITGSCKVMIRMGVKPKYTGKNSEFRVDPHPAWDSSGNLLVLNGVSNGIRSVFIADFTDFFLNDTV